MQKLKDIREAIDKRVENRIASARYRSSRILGRHSTFHKRGRTDCHRQVQKLKDIREALDNRATARYRSSRILGRPSTREWRTGLPQPGTEAQGY